MFFLLRGVVSEAPPRYVLALREPRPPGAPRTIRPANGARALGARDVMAATQRLGPPTPQPSRDKSPVTSADVGPRAASLAREEPASSLFRPT